MKIRAVSVLKKFLVQPGAAEMKLPSGVSSRKLGRMLRIKERAQRSQESNFKIKKQLGGPRWKKDIKGRTTRKKAWKLCWKTECSLVCVRVRVCEYMDALQLHCNASVYSVLTSYQQYHVCN